jgi:hypothetical protein
MFYGSEFYEMMVWIGSGIALAMIVVVSMWVHVGAQLEEAIHPQHRDPGYLLDRIL